ncbi:hypothetical protein Dmats_45885 [Dactylosporangium matsuzakiense]|nr:hypothetical protein Dmats_45885 [Dactylosporangium matsuzakiense]
MPYLSERTVAGLQRLGSALIVTPRSRHTVRRAAEQLAQQFRRETRYDFTPYTASAPDDQHVVLIPTRRFMVADGALYAGAIGVEPTADYHGFPGPVPRATWVYLHPYVRRDNLIDDLWPAVTAHWPGLTLAGPFTTAGLALLRRLVHTGLHPAQLHGIDVETLD